jgi:cellulose synthase/poly-beta-1,6-N-acetylglucosamine synthase-like glycosyltransferase
MEWVFIGAAILASTAIGILLTYFGLVLGTLAAIESTSGRRLPLVACIYFFVNFLPVYAIFFLGAGPVGWIRLIVEFVSFLMLIPLLIYLSQFPPPKALLIAVYAKLLNLALSFLVFW